MNSTQGYKRSRPQPWGRGVTVAFLTFNQAGAGSNPSDPTLLVGQRVARSSVVRAASL